MRYLSVLFILLVGCKAPTPAADVPPTVTLNIAALNDWHGALYELPVKGQPELRRGGLPWLAGAIDSLRDDHPDLMIFDGGDIFKAAGPSTQVEELEL